MTTQSFDLSTYAGQDAFVAVRYISDGSVNEPGMWLSGMSVGGTPVSDATDLSAWTSLTGAVPVPVENWTVQLVGRDGTHRRSPCRSTPTTPSRWIGGDGYVDGHDVDGEGQEGLALPATHPRVTRRAPATRPGPVVPLGWPAAGR